MTGDRAPRGGTSAEHEGANDLMRWKLRTVLSEAGDRHAQ